MSRRAHAATWAGIVFLLSGAAAFAAGPIVRAHIEPKERVMVGQEQRLIVEILVPTWLLGAPILPELEIPGVIVVSSGESAVNLSETIDGATWSGVSNEYVLYAQRPGSFATPPDLVRITYSQDGAPRIANLPIPSERFVVRAPPGTRPGESVLAATGLQISQEIEPAPDGLRVGDALRRTVRVRAENTRAMLLPEFGVEPLSGLAAYPDTPKLVDRPGQRGGAPTAERVESTSWILERPGTYELPPVVVRWWNVAEERLETAEVPGVLLSVAPNPALEGGADEGSVAHSNVPATVVVVGLFIGLFVAWRRGVVAGLRGRFLAWVDRARHSERASFGALVRATRAGDSRAILRALFSWLDRRSPADVTATTEEIVAISDDTGLGDELAGLEASLFANDEGRRATDGTWSPAGVRRKTVIARARLQEGEAANETGLGPLNPDGGLPNSTRREGRP